jgi:phenylalanyl-tRNA synthetase beta subunit
MTALVVANKNKLAAAPYYQAKRMLDYLCESLGIKITYKPFEKELDSSLTAPFEYRRSAQVINQETGKLIGIVGEYKKSIAKGFKLPEQIAGFEIKTVEIFNATIGQGGKYSPLSRYPASERDVCFQVENSIQYSQIIDAASSALLGVGLETSIVPIDIYQAESSATKNITIRVRLTSHDHTLTGDEVTTVINSIITSVTSATRATVI